MSRLAKLVRLPYTFKLALMLLVDSFFILSAMWISFAVVSHGKSLSLPIFTQVIIVGASLLCFIKFGFYRAVLRYVSYKAIKFITLGLAASTCIVYLAVFQSSFDFPILFTLVFTSFLTIFVGSSRILIRASMMSYSARKKEPVIVYGAGSAGRELARALESGNQYYVYAFVDDDERLHGKSFHGIDVYSPKRTKSLSAEKAVTHVLLAMPSVCAKRRKHILTQLQSLSLKVLTIPSISELVDGVHQIDHIEEIDAADLLGRDPIKPNQQLLAQDIFNKVVMVTGAGGSIGSELCRKIIRQKPSKLILFELSEYGLYRIEQELRKYLVEHALDIELVPLLGSVQKQNRVFSVLKTFNVSTVYHAAAYKHVPLVEYNIIEGVRNNVFGTLFTAQAAIDANVSTFVLVSTDKAVRPTNVMGASKRLAELTLQALAARDGVKTRFSMVRFGNVLGSSGSVVPLFREQIKHGGPVTVTHPEITRYFMTIPEASELVIQAGAMAKGGDVFVLDMGEPVKITDSCD